MTSEILIAIASLCQASGCFQIKPNWDAQKAVDEKQLGCQKYFLECIDKKRKIPDKPAESLSECVLERGFEKK